LPGQRAGLYSVSSFSTFQEPCRGVGLAHFFFGPDRFEQGD
jgi:hypothetical protein